MGPAGSRVSKIIRALRSRWPTRPLLPQLLQQEHQPMSHFPVGPCPPAPRGGSAQGSHEPGSWEPPSHDSAFGLDLFLGANLVLGCSQLGCSQIHKGQLPLMVWESRGSAGRAALPSAPGLVSPSLEGPLHPQIGPEISASSCLAGETAPGPGRGGGRGPSEGLANAGAEQKLRQRQVNQTLPPSS